MATQDRLAGRDYSTRASRDDVSESAPIGYAPENGVGTKSFPGDDEFPFVKDPSSVSQTYQWRHAFKMKDGVQEPNSLTTFTPEATHPADVSGHRVLDLTVRFYPVVPAGSPQTEVVLGIFPEAGIVLPPQMELAEAEDVDKHLIADDSQNTLWVPIGVVDPVIRGVDPVLPGSVTSAHPPCMGFRNVYATQLNLRGEAQNNTFTVNPCLMTLAFDVTPYTQFRVRVGLVTTISGSTLPLMPDAVADLYYALER